MSSKTHPDQETPTHYASLRWICAFGEAMFDGNMEWAKRNDPDFGAGSFSHIVRLVPEHLFVMKKQMDKLKNDAWKSKADFKGYLSVVDGVKKMDDLDKCGKEYFERLPDLFFERFEESLAEHTKKWRSTESLPVIIAGHPLIYQVDV